jgi:SAM-dependent methyltransferase
MIGACQAARAMFGFPTVGAWSQQLPFADATFDAAWCLGVLCTTTDKSGLLHEIRRVLAGRGRLGLLVLVQLSPELTDAPEGNDFPTGDRLLAELAAAGFTVDERTGAGAIKTTDDDWERRVAEVEQALADRYGDRPGWQLAHEQELRIGRLLRQKDLETWLLTAHVSG